MEDIPEGKFVELGKNNGGLCSEPTPNVLGPLIEQPATPVTTNTTTPTPTPRPVDCQKMNFNAKVIRNTMIANGCGLADQCFSRNTWSQISCLEDIRKKSDACVEGPEKMDCKSLEELSKNILAVIDNHC